jgi:broad specificity phosphatase PhoE
MTIDSDHTHFYLVRHGETDANKQGYVGGSTDDALTERGHAQAKLVAAHLGDVVADVAAIYASPLKRAWETAEHIGTALGKTPESIDDLVEWHAGDWEKLEYTDIPMQEGFSPAALIDPAFAPPNGESLGAVQTRVVQTLRDLNERHIGERVIVVSHGSALALSLAHLIDNDLGAWMSYRLENCSVSELILGPNPALLEANQTRHLTG